MPFWLIIYKWHTDEGIEHKYYYLYAENKTKAIQRFVQLTDLKRSDIISISRIEE
jgi:hypothetical protein